MGENLLIKGRKAVDTFFMKEHVFKSGAMALEKAVEIRKKHDYRPRIHSFESEKKYVVVEPRT